MLEFTYLSENIEKHANPNNTCEIYSKETFDKNLHPYLDFIPYHSLTKEDGEIMEELVKMKYLKKTDKGFEGKFPRLMIQIKDKELLSISENTKPEVYKFLETGEKIDKKKFKIPKKLRKYFCTINDIKVRDIMDKQNTKIAFEKILGDKSIFDRDVMMYGKNKQTLFAAAKRQLKTAPTPDPQITKEFINYSEKVIDKEIGYQLKHFSYDLAQWYNHLSRSKQDAIEPIMNYYLNPEKCIEYDKKKIKEIENLEYEAICKAEIQGNDGKPRMVCAIPQRIKYTMGPVTWQLEEICQNHLKGYCGGKNLTEMAQQLNEYIDQGFTKVVEGDGSAFDNSQDVTLKELDRYIYSKVIDKVYHVPKQDFKLISNLHYKTMNVKYQKENKKMETYIRYKILGTVFSGDCDTTLANTIRMAMYNRFVNEKEGLKYGVDFLVMSKGDDFSVMYKPYVSNEVIQNIYNKYFLQKPNKEQEILDTRQYGIGQICKFLEFGQPNSFKFCSLRSWYIDDRHITLTRDPAKLYHQSLYSIKTKNYNPKQRYCYHIDMARSYLVNYPGIHIFELMAKAHIKEATQIRQIYNIKISEVTKKTINQINKIIKMKKTMVTNPLGYNESYNKLLTELMEIKGREKYYNMYLAQYWEQIKRYEMVRTEVLSKEQLKYVNQQIQLEFDTEELKSLLALNKNEH